jgi:hypothetical protein
MQWTRGPDILHHGEKCTQALTTRRKHRARKPCELRTPRRHGHFTRWQVSWLTGHKSETAFPALSPVARSSPISPLTVAGAATNQGESLYRVPFSLYEPTPAKNHHSSVIGADGMGVNGECGLLSPLLRKPRVCMTPH